MSKINQETVIITINRDSYRLSDFAAEYNLPELPDGILFEKLEKNKSYASNSELVEVIDDPRLIDWVRKAHDACLSKRFDRGLREVLSRDYYLINSDDHYALEEGSDQAIGCLHQILNNPQAQTIVRAKAAQMLNALGIDEGIDFLLSWVNSPDTGECASALEVIKDMVRDYWVGEHDYTWCLDPATSKKILELVASADSQISSFAAEICVLQEIPGIEEALQTVIAKGQGPIDTFADLLISEASKAESMELAMPLLLKEPLDGSTSVIKYGYENTLNHPNPAISKPFREAILKYLLKYKDKEPKGRDEKERWNQDLCCAADESVLPILEDILANSNDSVSRSKALEAIARLKPETAVKQALAEIPKEKPLSNTIEILRKYANESNLENIFALRYQNGDVELKGKIGAEDVLLLLHRFGTRGKDWLLNNRDKFSAEAFQAYRWAEWLSKDLTVDQLLTDMRLAGIIDQTPEELFQLVAALRRNSLSKTGWAADESLIYETLRQAGILTDVSGGYGLVPPDHESLIREYARNSNGRFRPECQIQIHPEIDRTGDYKAEDDDDDDDDPFWTVCFVYRERLYRFIAYYNGDYYSTLDVVHALNTALRLEGQPERYIRFLGCYLFADPDLFFPITERYAL